MPYYAGIGSRKTPPDILDLMERIADCLADEGYTLRSGHAHGADQAFERGCQGNAEIFLPWPTFKQGAPCNGTVYCKPNYLAYAMAQEFHPAWDRLTAGVRAFHARNMHQVLGPFLDDPVDFVVCWTPRGERVGGTGMALRVAGAYEIPVRNLFYEKEQKLAYEWVL